MWQRDRPTLMIAFLAPIAMLVIAAFSTVTASVLASSGRVSEDWAQWRGPNRDGIASQFTPPSSWPERLNRAWQVEVGTGHSSPVVVEDRVYLHARNEEADEETVFALQLGTGETVWTRSQSVPYRMHPAALAFGKGPVSTPVVWEGKLYTLGKASVLSCYAIESGELLWSDDFSSQFVATVPLFGAGMSPQIEDGMLLVHLGGPQNGAFMALDPQDGSVIWRFRGDGPSYVSPIVVTLQGQRQVITQTDAHIVGLALEDGKLLWRIPFKTEFDQNVVTPLIAGEQLLLSGLYHPLFAIELVRDEESWTPQQIWSNPALSLYMSSPVMVGDRVFGMTHRRKGQFFAVDPATGETLWTSIGRDGQNASLVVVGDLIALLTEEAQLFLIDPDAEEFAPLRDYSVADSPTWAHPVFTNAGILIKDHSTLALWQIPEA